jgi:cell division septum initiation protein DivIVA
MYSSRYSADLEKIGRMEEDVLKTIIAVEREVLERLVEEERRAVELLDSLRSELAEKARREEERLAAEGRTSVAAARAEAQERADAILRAAAVQAEQLAGLDDGALERYVMKHLIRIAPEQSQ